MRKTLLILLGMLTALPIFSRDFSYTYEGQTITYTVIDEDAKTVKTKEPIFIRHTGNNVKGTLVLPSNPKDGDVEYTLISIGRDAFYECSGLTSVTIPNSVTEIGEYAFYECTGLTSVSIPNSVNKIGNNAFDGCSTLKSVEIPYSVIHISDHTFYRCSSLTSVTIPNSVTSIGGYAFSGCSGLTSVTIPNSVTSIGGYAFSGCSSLNSVSIPNSVTSIGYGAFKDCSGLEKAEFASIESLCEIYFWDEDANPLYYAHHLYIDGSEVTDVVIPESITSIGKYAFRRCSGLTSIKSLCETAPYIEDNAFEGLYDTVEVIVPDNSLISYLNLGWELFSNLKTIGGKEVSKFTDDVFQYRVIGEDSAMLVAGNYKNMTSVSIPERVFFNDKFYYVTYINWNAFSECSNIKTLSLPKHLEVIGASAFYECNGLTSVTIPNSVTDIESGAFWGCRSLTSVIFGNSVTSIGGFAFWCCSGLTSVSIPSSITVIGRDAFDSTSLKKVEFASIEALCKIYFEDYDANPLYCAPHLYIDGREVTDVIIPESVTKIGGYTFWGCSSLTSVTIPNSVTEIGEEAFYKCSGLTSVIFGNSVTSIGKSAFCYCSGLKSVTIPNSVTKIGGQIFWDCTGLNSVIIGNSVTEIGERAFGYCRGLKSVSIPNSVTEIGEDAFTRCRNLTDITFEDGSTPIELDKTSLSDAVTNLYMGRDWNISLNSLSNLQSLTLGNTVTAIPDSAFLDCSKLSSVKFGSSVESIGKGAFSNCNLTELVLSPATKTIGTNAFKGNNLKKIALGANVTEIGGYAFDGANSLESVSITALTPPAAENTTFSYYACPLYVSPSKNDAVKDAYYNFTRCWYRFSGYDLIPIDEVKIAGNTTVNPKPGESIKLTATISPADASLPYIFWRSTNPEVATVDKDGNVTMVAHSSAESRAAGDQTCEIIAETLYADGPVATVTVTAEQSDIDEIFNDFDDPEQVTARPNDIYNLQGICLKRNASDDEVKALSPGLYIIGGKKVLIK